MTGKWDALIAEADVRAAIAAERPVPTREEVEKWYLKEYPKVLEDNPGWIGVILAALSYFSSPREARPIDGMSVAMLEGQMRAEGQSFAMPKSIEDAERMMRIIQHDCARVAHRLAQPVPKVDPDAEAKRLAWLQYDTQFPVGHAHRGYSDVEELWNAGTDAFRNGWRAVAAAKEAGK